MVKVATFNVNSVRARVPVLQRWLQAVQPDVVALQETKVEDSKFPLAEFEALGYDAVFHGQMKYNGVAILSRLPIDDTDAGFDDDWPVDCRVIRATVNDVTIINTYVPNGTAVGSEKFDYKLKWLEHFPRYIESFAGPQDRLLWMGDINIAPTPLDVYDPARFEGGVGFHPEERARLEAIKQWGWHDCYRGFHQGSGHYTYWDYFIPNVLKRNLGWRIDHVYSSPGLAGRCVSCEIDKEPREWERPSDHTPVVAVFDVS